MGQDSLDFPCFRVIFIPDKQDEKHALVRYGNSQPITRWTTQRAFWDILNVMVNQMTEVAKTPIGTWIVECENAS